MGGVLLGTCIFYMMGDRFFYLKTVRTVVVSIYTGETQLDLLLEKPLQHQCEYTSGRSWRGKTEDKEASERPLP